MQGQRVEHFFQIFDSLSDLTKPHALVGVQIEDHHVGPFQIVRTAAPDVKFQRAELRFRDQTPFVFQIKIIALFAFAVFDL